MDEILQTIGILALVALAILALVAFLRSFDASVCVRGGYAAHRTVKHVGVCVGVDQGGTWKAEPVRDVRARLEQD